MNPSKPDWVDRPLFWVISSILVFLVLLLSVNLYLEHEMYQDGIDYESTATVRLAYAAGWDAAVVKTSTLFLSFMLLFVGALYVLRTAEQRYAASVEGKTVRGSFETSSPGLAIITLGVVLAVAALYSKADIDYTVTEAVAAQDQADTEVMPVAPPVTARPRRPGRGR